MDEAETNLFIWCSHFQTQLLKSYLWFLFLMFDSNLVKGTYNTKPEGVVVTVAQRCLIIA
jgi:hypothetical protein